MSCQTQLVISPLPSGSCLPEELYDYLTTGLQIVAGECGDCICFVSQTTSPGPEQLDYRWELITSTGVPLYSQVFYNGEWRRAPTVPIGAEVFFSGDPDLYFNASTGYGTHGGQWDGWQIDTTNSNSFPVIASSFSTSGLGWVVNYNAQDVNVGGSASILLDATNTYRPANNGFTVYLWEADGNSPGGDSALYGKFNASAPAVVAIPADPGNTDPPTIPIYPNFVAKALVVYRGLEGS